MKSTIKIDAGVLEKAKHILLHCCHASNRDVMWMKVSEAMRLLETAQPQPEVTADDSYRKTLEDERSKLSSRVIELESAIKDMWGDVDALLTRCVKYRKTNDRNLRLSTPSVQEVTEEKCRIALSNLYDRWENGDPCYEYDDGEKGSFIGNAFLLSDEEETEILRLIPKERIVRGEGEK